MHRLHLLISLAELMLFDSSQLMLFGVSVGLTVGLAFLLFYSGGFGGADSKALMCLAVALPFAPTILITPLLAAASSPISQFIFPFTILTNGVLFAAASGIYMILRNVIWHKKHGKKMFTGTLRRNQSAKKYLVLITGYKVNIEKIKAKWHVFPMEDIEIENPLKQKLVIVPHDEGRDKIVERLSECSRRWKNRFLRVGDAWIADVDFCNCRFNCCFTWCRYCLVDCPICAWLKPRFIEACFCCV